jgi:hypothetical protein
MDDRDTATQRQDYSWLRSITVGKVWPEGHAIVLADSDLIHQNGWSAVQRSSPCNNNILTNECRYWLVWLVRLLRCKNRNGLGFYTVAHLISCCNSESIGDSHRHLPRSIGETNNIGLQYYKVRRCRVALVKVNSIVDNRWTAIKRRGSPSELNVVCLADGSIILQVGRLRWNWKDHSAISSCRISGATDNIYGTNLCKNTWAPRQRKWFRLENCKRYEASLIGDDCGVCSITVG